MGERLVDRGGLFANFDTTSIRRRALPYRFIAEVLWVARRSGPHT